MTGPIDNYPLIRPLLKWENKGDFYYIQVLKRKKDGTTKYANKNNSARLVCNHQVYSLEEMDERMLEIRGICDLTKARAGIQFNRITDKVVAQQMSRRSLEAVISGNYRLTNLLQSILGDKDSTMQKYNTIDVDTKDEKVLSDLIEYINQLQPFDKTNKILATLPTYSGYHLITENFRQDYFEKYIQGKDISNTGKLCALYYPAKDEEDIHKL